MNKPYSFKREYVAQIFKDAVREGLKPLESKRLADLEHRDRPNYCPYHQLLGHSIQDCYIFKDWVERNYRERKLNLDPQVIQDPPAPHRVETSHHITHSDPEMGSITSCEEDLASYSEPELEGPEWIYPITRRNKK